MDGLRDGVREQILHIACRFGVCRLVLFGSRARGDFGPTSDIDLAVYGLPIRDEMAFRAALDELPTLLKCDVIAVRTNTDPLLLKSIQKDGVVWMERELHKMQQYRLALARLHEAVAEAKTSDSAVVRDGVIQRFEFTAELAWKTCRELLMKEGYVEIDSPKSAMRQAFAAGLVTDAEGWSSLLQARNITSHIYSEEQAQAIYEQVTMSFLPLFDALESVLSIRAEE